MAKKVDLIHRGRRVYPKTIMEAVYDSESGQDLKEVINGIPKIIVVSSEEELNALDVQKGTIATVFQEGKGRKLSEIRPLTEEIMADAQSFVDGGGKAEDYVWNVDEDITTLNITSSLENVTFDASIVVFFDSVWNTVASENPYADIPFLELSPGEIYFINFPISADIALSHGAFIEDVDDLGRVTGYFILSLDGLYTQSVVDAFNSFMRETSFKNGFMVKTEEESFVKWEEFVTLSPLAVCDNYQLKTDGWEKKADVNSVDAKVGSNANNIQYLQWEIDDAYDDISNLQTKTNNLQNKINANKSNISLNESNIILTNSKVNTNAKNISTNKTNISNLQTKVDAIQTNVNTNTNKLTSHDNAIEELSEKVDEAVTKVDDFLPSDYLIQLAQGDGRLMCELANPLSWVYDDDGNKIETDEQFFMSKPFIRTKTYRDADRWNQTELHQELKKLYSLPVFDPNSFRAFDLCSMQKNLEYVHPNIFESQKDTIPNLGSFFSGTPKLKSVTMPKSMANVTSMNAMFYNCMYEPCGTTEVGIESFTFPEDMPKLETADNMFIGCYRLNHVVFPKNAPLLKTINSIFQYSPNMLTIEMYDLPSLTSVNSLFYGKQWLEKITLPTEFPNVTNASGMFGAIGAYTSNGASVVLDINVPSMPKCKNINSICAYWASSGGGTSTVNSVTFPDSFPSATTAQYAFCHMYLVSTKEITLPELPLCTDMRWCVAEMRMNKVTLKPTPKIKNMNHFAYYSDVTEYGVGSLQECSNVTDTTYAFTGYDKLTTLPTGFLGGLKISISFETHSKLTRESILNVINAVADLSTEGKTATLTLHATAKARLTEDDIAIATAKGWTIA